MERFLLCHFSVTRLVGLAQTSRLAVVGNG
jgi:hypothetical protein